MGEFNDLSLEKKRTEYSEGDKVMYNSDVYVVKSKQTGKKGLEYIIEATFPDSHGKMTTTSRARVTKNQITLWSKK